MDFFTNVTNIFDSPIPNYNINARIKFNYDNDTVIIEWDKPIENNSYIKGYQLRNNNNILESFNSLPHTSTISLTNNTPYFLTLLTIYEEKTELSWSFGGTYKSNSNLPIPNGPINTKLDINPDTHVATLQWDKPKENSSYITGYQLKNHNNILQSFSPTSNIATINLTNNTRYSLTLETLYVGGSIISAVVNFTPNLTTKNNSNIPTSLPTTLPATLPASLPATLPTTLPATLPATLPLEPNKISNDFPIRAAVCRPGECGLPFETIKTENNYNPLKYIYTIFHSILTLFAIYLSFKCNEGFDFLGFLMAIFFPYIYIIYKYATSETFCDILNDE
jgi:hypothetical protein